MVEYKYDAWGKIIARTGSLVSTLGYLNPFRYRGYIYDEETGLYYLKSRYYTPEWGRFISADVVLGKVGGVLGHNLFAYCHNNPIVYFDPNGKFFKKVIAWADTKFLNDILNDAEEEVVAKYPLEAFEVYWARNESFIITEALFGANWNSDDTRENAFKHCLWNALAAYKIGVDKAREFGEAHEVGMMELHPDSTKMDLHNNEMGYAIVQAPLQPWEYSKEALARYTINYQSKYTTGDWKVYVIIDRVYRALGNGALIYLK